MAQPSQTITITGTSQKTPDPDDVLITVGGVEVSGWMTVRISAGIERCPRDFDVTATEVFPGTDEIIMRPGDECTVFIGKDKVLTGYVNRHSASITATGHTVSVSGRGACQDVVDCSAEWPGQQIQSTSVLKLAQDLCAPLGVTVRGVSGPSVGEPGTDRSSRLIPYMVLMLGETVWDLIDRTCKVSGLLAYEDADGALVLAEGPSAEPDAPLTLDVAGTGFAEGVNVVSAALALSDDHRFSQYEVYWFSFNPLLDIAEDENHVVTAADVGVKRYRPMVMIAETGKEQSHQTAVDRANWEAARRYGQGHQLTIVTDSWRDGNGKLYRPFTLARLELPTLKISRVSWMVSEVTYIKNANGTSCELKLAPVEAFTVQPTLPQYAIPAELVDAAARIRVAQQARSARP
jgi:prophage tail gpP-like protein